MKLKRGLLNELNKNEKLFKREYLDDNRQFPNGRQSIETSQDGQRERRGVSPLSDEQSRNSTRQDAHLDGNGVSGTRSLGDSEQRDSLSLVVSK